ncbi:hypothetical protein CCM_09650 [Cordyceps militaris CM01]|uniref:Uncharacterized protein n=1 Tax=Cordyceps militaris (strain CM01) TaxID=983644 RepID=G3JV13_CORMM|nr:uncharacterized protein CCM_09650 [Cordyceps militaris CM01]EGX87689.1 hypothetical protein CCM_09650 [Cordyceps militaris CM01]
MSLAKVKQSLAFCANAKGPRPSVSLSACARRQLYFQVPPLRFQSANKPQVIASTNGSNNSHCFTKQLNSTDTLDYNNADLVTGRLDGSRPPRQPSRDKPRPTTRAERSMMGSFLWEKATPTTRSALASAFTLRWLLLRQFSSEVPRRMSY